MATVRRYLRPTGMTTCSRDLPHVAVVMGNRPVSASAGRLTAASQDSGSAGLVSSRMVGERLPANRHLTQY
jgi:hypothetical protein